MGIAIVSWEYQWKSQSRRVKAKGSPILALHPTQIILSSKDSRNPLKRSKTLTMSSYNKPKRLKVLIRI